MFNFALEMKNLGMNFIVETFHTIETNVAE